MSLTIEQLSKIMPHTPKGKRDAALPIINAVALAYDISNERRMAAWLATLAVESGELKYQEEIASGAAYEGRKDLGNTQKGDGRKFKGHGRIQITGRSNHQLYTNYLKKSGHLPFVDFIAEPRKLAEEPYATDSAGWFWAVFKKLNAYADRGDFLTTQTRVNGRNKKTGLPNHWKERNAYFMKGLSVLPDNFSLKNSAATPQPPHLSGASAAEVTDNDSSASNAADNIEMGVNPIVPTSVIGVEAVVAAPAPPPEPPKEDVVTRISNRLLAIPAAILGALGAVGTWAMSAPQNLILALVIATAVIIVIYFIINSIRNAGKEKREAAVLLEQQRRDAELAIMNAKHAQEVQMIMLTSAARKDMNAVKIVAPPVTEIPNTESEAAAQ